MRVHGVSIRDVYISWNWSNGDFNQEKGEKWLGIFPGLSSPELCEAIAPSDIESEFQRQNHPDVFVANRIPFKVHDFSVENEFVSDPTGHFRLNVFLEASNVEQAKEGFITWLILSGLTEEQIGQLDINYLQETDRAAQPAMISICGWLDYPPGYSGALKFNVYCM